MPGVCVALKWQQSSFKPSDPCRPWVWSVGRLCGAAVVKCLPSDCRTVIMMCWYVFPCLVEAFRLLCSCYFSVFMFLLCKCGGVTLLKKNTSLHLALKVYSTENQCCQEAFSSPFKHKRKPLKDTKISFTMAESSLNARFEVTTCLVLGVPLVFVWAVCQNLYSNDVDMCYR